MWVFVGGWAHVYLQYIIVCGKNEFLPHIEKKPGKETLNSFGPLDYNMEFVIVNVMCFGESKWFVIVNVKCFGEAILSCAQCQFHNIR